MSDNPNGCPAPLARVLALAAALGISLAPASCAIPDSGYSSSGSTGPVSTSPASGAGTAAQHSRDGATSTPPSTPSQPSTRAATGSPGPVLTADEVSDALDHTALDGVALVRLDAEGEASWRAPADEDLPPDVVEPSRCGALVWMPQTLGALRDGLPMDVRTLPQSGDPTRADITGVVAVRAPTAQGAVDRLDRLVELAGQCPTYTVALGGSSPTHLTATTVPIDGTDQASELVESRQGETLEQEVHVVARVGNVLVTVSRPAGDAVRVHRLVAAIAGQLRADA